jgi:hypothetical protein
MREKQGKCKKMKKSSVARVLRKWLKHKNASKAKKGAPQEKI